MIIRTACLTVALAFGGVVTSTGASADIMVSCAPVIADRCGDVRQGRGRMVACLAANDDQIDGSCKTDVDREMSKRIVRMSVPIGATPVAGTSYGDAMTGACKTEMTTLCAGVRQEVEPLLACFYARGNRVSNSCQETADKLIKDLM